MSQTSGNLLASPATWLQSAIDQQLAGKLDAADVAYGDYLAAYPDDAKALCLRGILAQQRGQSQLALEWLEGALAQDRDSPVFMHALANVLSKLGRDDEALSMYQLLADQHPSHLIAKFEYAQLLQKRRRYAQAIDLYIEILKVDPGFVQAYNDMGAAWIARKQFRSASMCIDKALAIDPDYAEAHNNRGVIKKNLRQFDAAIASYREALRCKPDYPMALFNLGTIHFIRKEYALAEPLYRQALALDPRQVESYQNLAFILAGQGKLEEAKWYSDSGYAIEHIFTDYAEQPVKTVFVLWAAGTGNIPVENFLSTAHYTRICCIMEYLTDADLASLPEFDLVFNAIGDRDSCDSTDAAVARLLRCSKKPLMNRPEAVRKTARDTIAALFAGVANVVCAPTIRHATSEFKAAVITSTALRFPIIVRPGGSHGGEHLEKVDSAQALQDLVLFNAPVYYASNYVDYLSADGYFRKYRIIFINRIPYPYHLAIGTHWIVHYATAEMDSVDWKLAEELAFLKNPRAVLGDKAMDAIEHIGREMNLDYCGIDFSLLPNQQVLVFEANATMLVHDELARGKLAHKNPYIQTILDAMHRHIVTTADRSV